MGTMEDILAADRRLVIARLLAANPDMANLDRLATAIGAFHPGVPRAVLAADMSWLAQHAAGRQPAP